MNERTTVTGGDALRREAPHAASEPPLVLTPGPWGWRQPAGSNHITLCTVGRGLLYILDPCRVGMNDATILFGHRSMPRQGGLLRAVPVRGRGAPDYLTDAELTPDARLIQAAPELLMMLRKVLSSPGTDDLPTSVAVEAMQLINRVMPADAAACSEGGAA
jgi:hypothetical protein